MTRYRIDLVGVRNAEKNRVEKLLEDAPIKLSDIIGVSGRAMMAALVAGQRDPTVLARWPEHGCGPRFPSSKRPSRVC